MNAPFDLTWITLLAVIALSCGFLLLRIRQPAIVGYIVAGVVLGPSGLGLVKDGTGVRTFAELGVLLLLFIIGMEISLRALRQIFVTIVAAALLQATLAVGIAVALVPVAGWPLSSALVFGFMLALSSTAVGIKLLEDIGELRTDVGRLTIGILVAQDLLVVPMLITINALGVGGHVDIWLAVKLVGAVAGLLGLVAFLSRMPYLNLPIMKRLRGHRDLAPLAALSFCLVLATLSGLLGLSASYGAFIAGLILGATPERRHILRQSLPIQSILMMVFFVSIGLLIDLKFLWEHLALVLILLVVTICTKTLLNTLVLRLLGVRTEQAFLAGVVMGQLGEFSFLVGAVALQSGAIDPVHSNIALAVIALSLLISPFWLVTLRRLERMSSMSYSRVGSLVEDVYKDELAALRLWARAAHTRLRIVLEDLGARWSLRRRARPPHRDGT